MAGRALSETAKKQKTRRAENAKMAHALEAYKEEQAKTSGTKEGLRKVAAKHGVNYRTLGRLHNGGVSMSAFNATKRALSPEEERIVINYALESADRGFPQTIRSIEQQANEIIASREGPDHHCVGVNWVDRLLERYRDEVQTHWSRPLDTARARSLNPTIVHHWFHVVVRRDYVDAQVRVEDTYAMDESGFPPESTRTQRVIGRRGTKTQHKQGNANRENVTALVTICADGSVLRPTIIFKGKNFMANWRENNVSQASFAHSPNGWTDGELAAAWLIDDFDAQTKEKAAGRPRALFLDGHSSHYTPELLRYAKDNNIIILGYPPHCTHALQGLDVVCFARMKQAWGDEVERFENEHDRGVNKGDFAGVFGVAFKVAFSHETVRAAFKATGIHPFNPDIITPAQMKPSEPSSVRGAFPLPQPSPVRAVMTAFHHHPRTAADVDPENHSNTGLTAPSTPTRSSHHSSLKSSPLLHRDPNIDPALYTPSKRMRILTSHLASTSSGSFLVSNAPITSAMSITRPVFQAPPPIPHPNWDLAMPDPSVSHQTRDVLERQLTGLQAELNLVRAHLQAREGMLEGANAQMVVQNMHINKLTASLKAKENKKATDRTKLFPEGKGRHLTDEAFIVSLEHQRVLKAAKAREKGQRKKQRAASKVEKASIEAEWKRLLRLHETEVECWQAEVERLTAAKVLKKDLPKKPKRPLKPKLALTAAPSGAMELSGSGSDESDSDEDLDPVHA